MRPGRGSRHCRHHYSRVPRKAPAPKARVGPLRLGSKPGSKSGAESGPSGSCLDRLALVWVLSGCLDEVWTSGSRLGRRLGLDPRVDRPFKLRQNQGPDGCRGLPSRGTLLLW